MGRQKTSGRPGAKGKQPSLLSGGFDFNKYPMLKKPMEVIGETPSTCRAASGTSVLPRTRTSSSIAC